MNLQLFAGEKTEPATPRRREEARKKGQVAKSGEVGTALIVLGAVLLLKALSPHIAKHLTELVHFYMENMWAWDGDSLGVQNMFLFGLTKLAIIVGPLLAGLLVIGFLSQVVQVGLKTSSEALLPKFSRINPIEGFKRIFSKRSLVEFFKSLAKISLVGYLVYRQVSNNLEWLPQIGL